MILMIFSIRIRLIYKQKMNMGENNKHDEKKITPRKSDFSQWYFCLLYTSDAADDLLCVDLGGRRIINKKKREHKTLNRTLPKT